MRIGAALCLIVVLVTLASRTARADVVVEPKDQSPSIPGISGMAEMDGTDKVVHLLCVHDYKDDAKYPGLQQAARFGVLTVVPGAKWKDGERMLSYDALPNPDWAGERASDLEGVCALPGHPGEYLANESSYFTDKDGHEKYGRIFRIRVEPDGKAWKVTVLDTIPLPHYADDIEAIACAPMTDGRLLLLLGERGGKIAYWPGWLRWGWLNLDQRQVTPPTPVENEYSGWMGMYGPGFQQQTVPDLLMNHYGRAISDLYIDPLGQVWASSAADMGDAGPFRSYITRMAQINPGSTSPVESTGGSVIQWKIEGVKIEALCGPYHLGAVLSYATDDETYGATWRPLGPASGSASSYF
jgi:hypothetical protein